MSTTLKLFLATALSLISLSTYAGVLNFAWDNDLLVAKDRGYTNGIRLSWLGDPIQSTQHTDNLKWLPGFSTKNNNAKYAYSFSIRQSIVTPEDIESVPPVLNDLPYAGHLSLEAGVFRWTPTTLIGYEISAGVVGPESGAKGAQLWFHKMIGSSRPQGWNHQLGTDWQAGIKAIYGHRFTLPNLKSLEQEWIFTSRASLDTYRTGAELGVSWRFGRHLPRNFLLDNSSLTSAAGLPGLFDHPLPGWSVFTGAAGEWVPHSYLGKNSAPYRYRQEKFVFHGGVGAALHGKNWNISAALRVSTDQDTSHRDKLTFGTVSGSWLF